MIVQSSFLIRCALPLAGSTAAGKPFQIQHIQTGAEYRAATLAEIAQWIADQNLQHLTYAINSEPKPGTPEETQ